MKLIWVLALSILLASCAAPKSHYTKHIASTEAISLTTILHMDPLQTNKFEFHGEQTLATEDEKTYGMAYPGGLGIAGFLVGVATHSVVEDQMQNSRASKEQETSDAILIPISDLISTIDAQLTLIHAAQGQKQKIVTDIAQQTQNPEALRLNIAPVFYVAVDYTELSIKAIITVYESVGGKNKVHYQNLIDVVRKVPDNITLKDLDKGNPMVSELVEDLVSEAIHLGLADATHTLNEAAELKTFKLAKSGNVSYERAKLVRKDCSVLVIRTLRNWIKSVPMSFNKDESLKESCEPPRTGFIFRDSTDPRRKFYLLPAFLSS